MAKLPQTIKIGPHYYALELTAAKDMISEDDGSHMFGEYDPDKLKIRLVKRMRKTKQQETVVHEVLHACMYPADEDDEPFVTLVAPVLLQVLQDNPELIAYLTEE